MSFDLYLIPLEPTDDFDAAMAVFEMLDGNPAASAAIDVREAARTIIQMDLRYKPFEKDYTAIAKYKGITEETARQEFDYVELNGKSSTGEPLAQFIFYRTHVAIHCYRGTTADELDKYVVAICTATGLAAVDPQEGNVLRLQEDGTLA